VLVETDAPIGDGDVLGTSRITASRPDRVELEASLSAPGYVVLLEGFDPGWQARVDGEAVPILRANTLFRAVAAPAGHHKVELVYRPRGVRVGLTVSGLSLAVAVGWWFRSRGGR
jgi:uncharacterized membrane protein YfhO